MLGQRERVLNQFETRPGVFGNNDFHDVETKENVGIIQHSQPVKTAARDAFLLRSIDRRDGSAKILAGAFLLPRKLVCPDRDKRRRSRRRCVL
jgi:hypothetical protein